MKKRTSKGRPRGSSTGYTEPGLPLHENEVRAIWGDLHESSMGAAFAHQLWIERNPQPDSLGVRMEAERDGVSIEVALQARRARGREEIPAPFLDWMLDAIDRRDAKFFSDAAKMLARLNAKGQIDCHDKEEAALAFHTSDVLSRQKNHRFTLSELREIDWRAWQTTQPSERNLKRLAQKLGVPMRRGRTPVK